MISSLDTSKLPFALAPLYVLLNRIEGHAEKGRMLYGLRTEFSPVPVKAQGKKDYPILRLIVPAPGSNPSQAGSGRRAAGNQDTEESRFLTPVDFTMTVTFQLETSSNYGWITPVPQIKSSDRCNIGHLNWLHLIQDAIETDWTRDDIIDMRLCKTLQSPFSVETPDDPDFNDSSIASMIVVNMAQSFCSRGSRYRLSI